jgi:hypothetical protein
MAYKQHNNPLSRKSSSPLNQKDITEIRKEPGKSNAGKYPDVKDFAGPDGTYPINTIERGRSALKLAHNSPNPEAIKAKVYAKYPELKPEK